MRFVNLDFRLHAITPNGGKIERAEALLPNGRVVSVLRGMKSAVANWDYETCRLNETPLNPRKHATAEGVEEELAAVASLPEIMP